MSKTKAKLNGGKQKNNVIPHNAIELHHENSKWWCL